MASCRRLNTQGGKMDSDKKIDRQLVPAIILTFLLVFGGLMGILYALASKNISTYYVAFGDEKTGRYTFHDSDHNGYVNEATVDKDDSYYEYLVFETEAEAQAFMSIRIKKYRETHANVSFGDILTINLQGNICVKNDRGVRGCAVATVMRTPEAQRLQNLYLQNRFHGIEDIH